MLDRDFEIERLLSKVDGLRIALSDLKSDNEVLKSDNEVLRNEIKSLQIKIVDFESRLELSSRNSSLPPSKDTIANREKIIKSRKERRDEAREKAGADRKKRGKQPGAKGSNLPPKETPDEIIIHELNRCESCDLDLSNIEPESIERRQVFDIPDPVVKCSEHVVVKKRCQCGYLTAIIHATT